MTKHIRTSVTYKGAGSYGMVPGKTLVVPLNKAKEVAIFDGTIIWTTSKEYKVHGHFAIEARKIPDLVQEGRAQVVILQGEKRILVNTDDCQKLSKLP